MRAVLRRHRQTCLVEAVVLQRWYAARRDPRDIVIGVTSAGEDFHAHAWVDGDPRSDHRKFVALLRRPPPYSWAPRTTRPPSAHAARSNGMPESPRPLRQRNWPAQR